MSDLHPAGADIVEDYWGDTISVMPMPDSGDRGRVGLVAINDADGNFYETTFDLDVAEARKLADALMRAAASLTWKGDTE